MGSGGAMPEAPKEFASNRLVAPSPNLRCCHIDYLKTGRRGDKRHFETIVQADHETNRRIDP